MPPDLVPLYGLIDMVFLALENASLIFICLLCMGSSTSPLFTCFHMLHLIAFGRSGLRSPFLVPVDFVYINMVRESKPPSSSASGA